MPLRDHFRPPLSQTASWEGLHSQWPAIMVQQLREKLPPGFTAEPGVHRGNQVEIDVSAYELDEPPTGYTDSQSNGGGVATAVYAPAKPSMAVATELPEEDEYEVRIYDSTRGRMLVAAIGIISPSNKDRAESRSVFVGKCTPLLRKGVAVSIVDLVTIRHFNLYAELMAKVGYRDSTLGNPPPATYATSCRWIHRGKKMVLETWSNILNLGQPLPTLPLWLTEDLVIPLDLEVSYERACHDLWIN